MSRELHPPPFRSSDDKTVEVVQRDVREVLRQLSATEVIKGNLVTVQLSTSTTKVAHRLGRRWKGWIVVDTDSAATIHRDTSQNVDSGTYIPLVASAGTPNVTLWVF